MISRFLALTLVVSASLAQEYRLEKLPSGAAAPSGRVDGAIAYDPQNRRVYMFGGRDSTVRNDLWTYSVERREWTQLQPAGSPPPARFGHTLIFDPQRRRVVLFGGQSSGFFNDTWSYDVEANRWTMLAGSRGAPNERYSHSAIYDAPRDRMVISHGFTDEGRFDDTWAFDLSSNTWRDISPPGGSARPLRRCLHRAVADPSTNRMLLYGGCASGFGPCPLGDLWAFDLLTNRWTEINGGTKPAARQWNGMGFDAARGRLVIYGGSGDRGSLNDLWDFDPRTNSWTAISVAGDAPLMRQRHESAYAPDLGGVIFFGGSTNTGLSNDLLYITTRAASASGPRFTAAGIVNAFSNQSGPIAPGAIVSIYGSGLGPDTGVATTFDESGALPRATAGVTVTVNNIPAPIFYAQSGQLNIQIPYEVAGARDALIEVKVGGLVPPGVQVPVAAASPGLHNAFFKADGSLITPSNPSRGGDIIVLFATGAGVTIPAARTGAVTNTADLRPAALVQLRIDGQDAQIEFAGLAPGTAGVLQINARVPNGVASGARSVQLRIGDAEASASLTVE
ncbi:MAG: hypothetical protein JNL98_36025 [Bryobacterales bacterium]|nr:hypothetical protein [Bryobacterales bacterium]